jgi:hypothetical protein
MVSNIELVNEYEAQSAVIPSVGTIITKEYEMRQQCQLVGVLQQ